MSFQEDLARCVHLAAKVVLEIGTDAVKRQIISGRDDGQRHLESLWILAVDGKESLSFSVELTGKVTDPAFDRRVKEEVRKLDPDRWPWFPPEATADEAMRPAWRAGLTTVAAMSVGKNRAGDPQVILWHSPVITPGSAALLLKWYLTKSEARRGN